jgi:predicted Rossmann fold nucleotide-binding protein DprA/Smf involved in DNA uptake
MSTSTTTPRPPERLHWYIASVTGHRELGPKSLARLRSAMKGLAQNPRIDAIYLGGALGSDTEALKAALEYRQGKRPWLVVVVPDRLKNQPWHTRKWSQKADELIELGNQITAENQWRSYKIRDEYLVDVCSFLVAFFNGDYSSGTGYTVRYAEKDGLQVFKFPTSDL